MNTLSNRDKELITNLGYDKLSITELKQLLNSHNSYIKRNIKSYLVVKILKENNILINKLINL